MGGCSDWGQQHHVLLIATSVLGSSKPVCRSSPSNIAVEWGRSALGETIESWFGYDNDVSLR